MPSNVVGRHISPNLRKYTVGLFLYVIYSVFNDIEMIYLRRVKDWNSTAFT
jgi:hypothetical protein